MSFERTIAPGAIIDRIASTMLRAPEPDYIYAQAVYLAEASSQFNLMRGIALRDGTPVAPGMNIATLFGGMQIDLNDGRIPQLITVHETRATQDSQIVKFRRPVFSGGGYTRAARTLGRRQPISTSPLNGQEDTVDIVARTFTGPYATAGTATQPYSIILDLGNVDMQVESVGLNLYRDRLKWLDRTTAADFDSSATLIFPGDPSNAITADSSTVFPVNGNRPMDLETLIRARSTLRINNVPTFADGKYIAVLTPKQIAQLKTDPDYREQARENPDTNLLKVGYVATVDGINIYESNSNTIDTTTVSGVSINHAVMFGAGMVGRIMPAKPCDPRVGDDSNYGHNLNIIWSCTEGQGPLDSTFGVSIHSN